MIKVTFPHFFFSLSFLSHSGASVYNVGEEEEEEKKAPPTEDQSEENDLTMGKMKLLRAKMENLSVGKKVNYM